MAAFLSPGIGGILSIPGELGGIIQGLAEAKRGLPGQAIIPSPINKIIAATQINLPVNSCDPQAAAQAAAEQMQRTIIEIINNYTTETVSRMAAESPIIQQIQQQLTEIEKVPNSETKSQQIEGLMTERDLHLKALIVAAISFVSRAVPEAAKIANAPTGSIKLIAGVAAHLEAPIGMAINLGRYSGAEAVTVEVISSACAFG